MFRFSKTAALAAGSLLAVLVIPQLALGGMDNKPAGGATTHTPVESMARVPDAEAGRSGVFKCWQQGRLIFETSAPGLAASKLPGATRITMTGNKALQVLDLKQAVCILDSSE